MQFKVGDLVKFTEKMPGIITNRANQLTYAPRDRPLLIIKVSNHTKQDSSGYDYTVLCDKDEIICTEEDIELFSK